MKTLSFSKRVAFGAFLVCGLIALTLPVQADPDPRSDRERIQTVIIGKYASEMNLTPEQAEKFFPRLRQYQERVEGLQRAEHDARMELDRLSQSPDADRGRLQELLNERRRLEQDAATLKQDFLGDITGFLSPQQVSRCSILLDEVPQRVRQFMIEKQRERMQMSAPPGARGKQPYPDRPRRRGR